MFQFYPSSDDQIQLITSIAQKAGFGGGVVVDYPNSNKARKVFLCLYVGGGGGQQQQIPQGLDGDVVEDGKVRFEKRRARDLRKDKNGKRKSQKVIDRDWILRKKEVSIKLCTDYLQQMSHPVVVPETREGECSEGFKVHRTQAEACLLIYA